MARTIIGLAGYAGVGKDTVAKHLGFPTFAFAQALKDDVAPLLRRLGLDINNRADKETARDFLVAYGALARSVDPDYWINRLFASLPESGTVVITDVRYLNEAKAIESAGGRVFILDRPGVTFRNKEERRSFAELFDAERAGEIRLVTVVNYEGRAAVAAQTILGYLNHDKISHEVFDQHHAEPEDPEWEEAQKLHARETQERFDSYDLDKCGTIDGKTPLPPVDEYGAPIPEWAWDEEEFDPHNVPLTGEMLGSVVSANLAAAPVEGTPGDLIAPPSEWYDFFGREKTIGDRLRELWHRFKDWAAGKLKM